MPHLITTLQKLKKHRVVYAGAMTRKGIAYRGRKMETLHGAAGDAAEAVQCFNHPVVSAEGHLKTMGIQENNGVNISDLLGMIVDFYRKR